MPTVLPAARRAPCFMGMSEISSVPLAIMDFFKQFKSVAQQFPAVNEFCRVVFSLLFLPIRGVYWPCARPRRGSCCVPRRACSFRPLLSMSVSHVLMCRRMLLLMRPDSSIHFWKMSLATLAGGTVIPAAWVIYVFCVCNILMTLLQWFWASLILMGIYAKITGGKMPDADEGDEDSKKK